MQGHIVVKINDAQTARIVGIGAIVAGLLLLLSCHVAGLLVKSYFDIMNEW